VYYPETYELDTERDRAHFAESDAALLIVNGWQRLVPETILETFERGALGVHGSAHPPAGRGRLPLNWSLIEDLDRFLLSDIHLDAEADAGPVVGTWKFDVSPHDDVRTLYDKTAAKLRLPKEMSVFLVVRSHYPLAAKPRDCTPPGPKITD
jgi:UDP-4-amino-4-deoxy-L-arabinose formyltransferase/UDP-glucuronic acid dehydrogenase (UDP-4-keto-hexauronic acid decarboxylating)